MGRQHQGMDRPGVWQVPEGSREQGKMEKTGCRIICGAPTTLAVKGLMMTMMMKMGFCGVCKSTLSGTCFVQICSLILSIGHCYFGFAGYFFFWTRAFGQTIVLK